MKDRPDSTPLLNHAGVTDPVEPTKFDDWFQTDQGHEVWALFKRLAFKARNAGMKKYSARGIMHVIRWETSLMHVADPDEGFKVSDHWTPGLARVMIDRHKEFEGFFQLNEQKSDEYQPRVVLKNKTTMPEEGKSAYTGPTPSGLALPNTAGQTWTDEGGKAPSAPEDNPGQKLMDL
jgi:hypothetical protein